METFDWTSPADTPADVTFKALCGSGYGAPILSATSAVMTGVFTATCGETTDGGAAFAACTGSRVYDSTKAATTSPSDAACCKAAAAAGTVTHTGYLVDLYCWDKPNHMAIDGANLGTEPEQHTVHCLRDVQRCIDGGYALLEKKAGATSYSLKYKLDATGNANILKLIKTTKSIANFQVTATGTASADGLTLNGATFVEGGGDTLGFPRTLIKGAAGLTLDRVLEANGKGGYGGPRYRLYHFIYI